ncbi:anti-sigma factor domain-containing protein [Ruania rhizosphaerae]|uniref:anti-sigma factor domain-containing protein n=1 Tax=Ruania rhizosphaerae TaxID=1840413 RepID=UPI00135AC199|nr:anti-sigma factor [Ruania rhizosphaerae]
MNPDGGTHPDDDRHSGPGGPPGDWHPDEDQLLEVALDHADSDLRARVSAHLPHCGVCRREYDEHADVIEQLLPAVPRHSPSPEFEARVLARLRDDPATEPEPEPGEVTTADGDRIARGWGRRRALLAVAAAWVLGLVLGGAMVQFLEQDAPPAVTVASAPLMTSDGDRIGQVARSDSSDGPMLVIEVAQGPPGMVYTCMVEYADGSTAEMGQWSVQADGPNRWIVADDGVMAVELVGESGYVWSSARF